MSLEIVGAGNLLGPGADLVGQVAQHREPLPRRPGFGPANVLLETQRQQAGEAAAFAVGSERGPTAGQVATPRAISSRAAAPATAKAIFKRPVP